MSDKILPGHFKKWFILPLLFVGIAQFFVVICPSGANAYQLLGQKWPAPSSTFYVDIPGADGLWEDSFETAMYEWSEKTIFQYSIVRGVSSNPCDTGDSRNGVSFEPTDCSEDWGATTLAITLSWFVGSQLTETDIVFNSSVSWDVYLTSWQSSVYDFQRVAVHELGHALGLDHENRIYATIMRSYAGDITTPQRDDILGVAAIYGSETAATPATITVPPSDIDGNYTVTWAASATNGVTYVLQEATNSSFTASLRTAYTGSALSKSINGRADATSYYYRVKAIKFGYANSQWQTAGNGCTVTFQFDSNSCATLDTQLTIHIPCVDVDGQFYQVELISQTNETVPLGYLWLLGSFSPTADNSLCASFDIEDSGVNFPCLEVNGINYSVTLDYYKNWLVPSQMFWALGGYSPY